MANLRDVIYLSNEDYDILVSTGTVTINGTTITYNENDVYITPEVLASSQNNGLMSSSDKIKLNGIQVVTTSGSQSVSDGTNTLNFGSNAFNSTTIPTSYLSSASFNNNKLTLTPNSGSATEITFGSNAFTSTTIPTTYVSSITANGGLTNSGTASAPNITVDSSHSLWRYSYNNSGGNDQKTYSIVTQDGELYFDTTQNFVSLYINDISDTIFYIDRNYLKYIAINPNNSNNPATIFNIDWDEVQGDYVMGLRLQDYSNDSTYFEVTPSLIQHNGINLQKEINMLDLR